MASHRAWPSCLIVAGSKAWAGSFCSFSHWFTNKHLISQHKQRDFSVALYATVFLYTHSNKFAGISHNKNFKVLFHVKTIQRFCSIPYCLPFLTFLHHAIYLAQTTEPQNKYRILYKHFLFDICTCICRHHCRQKSGSSKRTASTLPCIQVIHCPLQVIIAPH